MPIEQMQGRVIYLLISVILLNLLYPLADLGTYAALIYIAPYAFVLGTGVYVVAVSRLRFRLAFTLAIITAIANMVWIISGETLATSYAAYILLVVFQAMLIYVSLEFIFTAQRVTRDVLFAGITVYFLIADTFIPLFMLIEISTRHLFNEPAFILNVSPDIAIRWTQITYYSFATLSTLGYGDIVPITSTAQAFAAMEASIGVLYIAILIGRLVGLHSSTV